MTDASTPATPPRGVTVTDTAPSGRSSSSGAAPVSTSTAAVAAPDLTRRGRLRKWDRPPPPHDWRWYVGNLGKTLISLGLLMFGFVAYQLWGTAIETARAQNKLESEFETLLAAAPPVEFDDPFVVTESTADDPAPVEESESDTADEAIEDDAPTEPVEAAAAIPVEDQNIPFVENGDAIARIEIPSIGVSDIVVAGVESGDLKKGPGHFADTPLPGQLGNAAIAGHRTTYGQPFHNVDQLQPGDDIVVTTLNGIYTYKVTGQQIVSPSDYQVVSTSDPTIANLTLVSCHPKWTAQQRIIITSELSSTESAPVGEPVLNYGRVVESTSPVVQALPGDDDVSAPDASIADGDVDGDGGVSGNLATDDTTDEASGSPDDAFGGDADDVGSAATTAGIADAFSDGWFSDPAANPHVGMWGLAVAAIAIGAYLLSRRTRRDWIGGLVGFIPFVVALYFFFQNVNRLLPPNL